MGWAEYHATWSVNGRLNATNCLKEHLIYIINDSSIKNKQILGPNMSLPMRIKLSQLCEVTVDVRSKVEEDIKSMNDVETKCDESRQRVIEEGIRDEMNLLQQTYAQDLKIGMKIKWSFRYKDEDGPNDEDIEWCAGKVTKVSNGSNMRKGQKHYRKGGDTES